MKIQVPYNFFDLKIALMQMVEILGEEGVATLISRAEKTSENFNSFELLRTKKEINQAIAEENGVSIDALISSPNYTLLVESYSQRVTNKLVEKMSVTLEITEIQAWSLIALSLGLLD